MGDSSLSNNLVKDLPTRCNVVIAEAALGNRVIGRFVRISRWPDPCVSQAALHGIEKRVVYILRSGVEPSRHYVGLTNDMRRRLDWHNDGPCGHTRQHRPWSLVVSMEFASERVAVRFEKYLKSGSGRAFAKRHFAVVDDE